MNTDSKIKKIQFKRGLKAALEEKLVSTDLGIPAVGEPIYETDTGRLKIGDGINPYIDLPYFSGSPENLPNFIIKDPLSNQILLFDANTNSWVNRDLTDEESIIYLDSESQGLSIKGYKEASQGDMLVKDINKGLTWVKPLSTDQLQTYTSAAYESAQNAGNSAVSAGNAAVDAQNAVTEARYINEATMAHVNDKFWWGTIEEYNALDHINAGTFHFITLESTDVEE